MSAAIKVRSNPKRHRLANGRHGGWVPSRPAPNQDHRLGDRLGTLPRRTPTGVVSVADLGCLPRIRDQGPQGSCGGHSARSILRYSFARKHGDKIASKWGDDWDLSPAGIYLRAREKDNAANEDTGVWNRLLWDAMREHGAPTEADAPYNPRVLTTKLSAAAVRSGKWHQSGLRTYRCDLDGPSKVIDRILQALAADMMVQVGFTCFSNLNDADDTGVLRMPGPSDREDGGHDVAGCTADVPARILWGPNSWGEWGGRAPTGAQFDERGYIGLPFEYIERFADDIWAAEIE
jgi:hypothetical protein